MEINYFEEILPNKFEYIILESEFESAEKFTCTLRAKISNNNDLLEWLRLFEKLTNTNWNLRSSKLDSAKFFVARNFVCHHSSYNKQTGEKDSKKTKNKTCGAKLSIRIKWNTKDVRYRDKYIKDGYLGIIKINFIHSHAVNCAESLRWLRRAPEIKKKFLELFNMGLTPSEAIRFHENEISKSHPHEMANRRVNPPKRWVYDIHYKWLLKTNEKDNVLVSEKSNDQTMEENGNCIIEDDVVSICDDDLNELSDDDHSSVCSYTSSNQVEEPGFIISNVSGAQIEDEPTDISRNKSSSQGNVVHLIYVREDCTVDKKYCKILSKADVPTTNIPSSAQTEDGHSSIVDNISGAKLDDETTEISCNFSSAEIGMEPTFISDNTIGAQIELLSNFQIELDRIVRLLKLNINDKHLYNLAEKYVQKLKRVNTSEQLHSFLVKSILSFHSEFDHKGEKQTSMKQKRKRAENRLTRKVKRKSLKPLS